MGHFDNFSGRGGQDHRTIRMIEQPMISKYIWASKENHVELLRRIRYYFHRQPNPLNKLTVTKEQYKHYFKFAFVRNPWARAYSWYKNVMRDEQHRKSYRIHADIPLNEFLRRFAGRGMLRPQTYWLTSFDGCIHLDYIGRFENLAEDFQLVCRRLNMSPLALPHKEQGHAEDYRQHYDKASMDLVSRMYRSDIEMFRYSFDV